MSKLFSNEALQGEIALVTGASRGIGASIAATLAAAGATVVGTATSQPGADGISAALQENGRGLVLNVADEASVQAEGGDDEASVEHGLAEVSTHVDVGESIVREGEPIAAEARPLTIAADPDTSEVKIEFAASSHPDVSVAGDIDSVGPSKAEAGAHKKVLTKSATDIERELEQLRAQALGTSASSRPEPQTVSVRKKAEIALPSEVLDRTRSLSIRLLAESEEGEPIDEGTTLSIDLPGTDSNARTRLDLEIDLVRRDDDDATNE